MHVGAEQDQAATAFKEASRIAALWDVLTVIFLLLFLWSAGDGSWNYDSQPRLTWICLQFAHVGVIGRPNCDT